MCQRKVDQLGVKEPWVWYAFKWCVEQFTLRPASIFSMLCCGGMVWMYSDMRESYETERAEWRDFLVTQTRALQQISERLTAMETKMERQ